MKNRRATYNNNVMQSFFTEDGAQRLIELPRMQFSEFDDFRKKYDSAVNPQNYAKRASILHQINSIGLLDESGIIDLDAISSISSSVVAHI